MKVKIINYSIFIKYLYLDAEKGKRIKSTLALMPSVMNYLKNN